MSKVKREGDICTKCIGGHPVKKKRPSIKKLEQRRKSTSTAYYYEYFLKCINIKCGATFSCEEAKVMKDNLPKLSKNNAIRRYCLDNNLMTYKESIKAHMMSGDEVKVVVEVNGANKTRAFRVQLLDYLEFIYMSSLR